MKVTFISTRIAGNDGVSLEAVRWKHILEKMGHKVTFVAGELDRRGVLIPELHFQTSEVVNLHDAVVYDSHNYKKIEKRIFELSGKIEGILKEFFDNGKKPDLLIVANVLSLPMHFPLAVALSRVIDDMGIPTIARHHDFWWERKRFLKSSMFSFFKKYFPPKSKYIKHVVINSISQKELKERFGLKSNVIADTFDFDSGLNKKDAYDMSFRKDLGISKDDVVFLQATRIVPRKRIEISIELIEKLNNPKYVLLIAGHSGDEGYKYEEKIRKLASESKARIIFAGHLINAKRKIKNGRRIYTLWDAFVNSDVVTYPTKQEGFGNQFVEATYFKKPIIMTPYEVYKQDISPLGYKVIEIPEKITAKTVTEIAGFLKNPSLIQEMVDKNFEISKNNFSFEATRKKIEKLLP
jgi:mannosylglucosylglycerate synthase